MRALLALAVLALVATPALAQNPSAEPSYGNASIAGDFPDDPHIVDLYAGGPVASEAPGCTSSEIGFVADAPDYGFWFEQDTGIGPIYIYVDSEEDTTLLVQGPDSSWWCDDDSFSGLNPLVEIGPADFGPYKIWVGTWDASAEAYLYISGMDPRHYPSYSDD